MRWSFHVFMLVSVVATFSCGDDRIHGDDWLVRSDLDSLTLQELSDDWADLDSTSMAGFLAEENPAAEFIQARAYRMLLEETVRDLGYLDDPGIASFERSWLRTEASIAMRERLEIRQAASISRDDIALLTDRPEERIWLSFVGADSEAVGFGPFRRFELPPDLALGIDSTAPGMLVETAEGLPVRLDSITRIDSALVEVFDITQPDSATIPIVMNGRLRFMNLATLAEIRTSGTMTIDTLLMDQLSVLYSDSASIPARSEVLLSSDYGTWTVVDISHEVAFFQTKFPFVPEDRYWMGFVLDNLLQQSYLEELFLGEAPAQYDSLRSEASEYALGLAFDELRADSVLNRIATDLTAEERAAVESESTAAWLDRLAGSRNLLLNDEIIRRLPIDPGEWKQVLSGATP